ncbi:EgtD Methyltransferase Superfamily protein [Pleurotus pulmonarius]
MAIQIVDAQTLNQSRHLDLQSDLSQQLAVGLKRPHGEKEIPTVLLYDERGLRLYDAITTEVSEYYLFGAEEEILKNKADEIVRTMHSGLGDGDLESEVVLELGAGSLRKTSHILAGLSRIVPSECDTAPITYYALDLEERELQRVLASIANSSVGKMLQGKVETKGLWGTYEDGLKFVEDEGSPISSHSNSPTSQSSRRELTSPSPTPRSGSSSPLHILFLGSSLGNFDRKESVKFLQSLPLRPGSGDTLLIGLDHDNDKTLIEEAYNDRKGYTKTFIMNGLRAAGRALGNEDMFEEDKWEYVNRYNEAERRHEAYYKSKCSQKLEDPKAEHGYEFLEDELVKIEVSYKYSETDAYSLFTDAGLRPIQRWTDSATQYSLWLLERPPFMFPLLKSPVAFNGLGEIVQTSPLSNSPFGVPSPQEWSNLWAAWDYVTLKMIPPSMLHVKPIHLRHICLFYLGHIPTFLDIHLSRLLKESHTEPESFKYIFERGIDPNVDNPAECHPHSEVPQNEADWPSLQAILSFQARVRSRLLNLYDDVLTGKKGLTRTICRILSMTFEHEAYHLETLLYMLLQAAGNGTIPPPGFTPPPWSSLSANWNALPPLEVTAVTLGPETVTLGHDDDEKEDEEPAFASDVKDHEFGWDNENPKRQVEVKQFKIEWRPVTNGQFYEFYKEHKDGLTLQLPASWVERDDKMMVRTLYGPVPMKVAQDWPVIVSYNGLSAYAIVKGGRLPTEPELRLFLDKFESGYEGGANLGFRNWHPVPATTGGKKYGGKGHNGGIWEWTSTTLTKHDGFEPSKHYPGFTADFFDGCHNVILGGAYASIPRMAERRSLRNWYQMNYPYAWTGGRIAYDI